MNSKRYIGTAIRILAIGFLVIGGVFLSRAGNPRLVNSVTGPLTWPNGQVPFNTDQGPLGMLSNATATQIVLDSFAAWEGVPTATMTSQNLGPILIGGTPVDITLANYSQVLFQLDGQSPIIYDHDGSIMDDLGVGFFAGVSFIEFLTGDLQHYLEGAIVLAHVTGEPSAARRARKSAEVLVRHALA